jgi:hypothetical protein
LRFEEVPSVVDDQGFVIASIEADGIEDEPAGVWKLAIAEGLAVDGISAGMRRRNATRTASFWFTTRLNTGSHAGTIVKVHGNLRRNLLLRAAAGRGGFGTIST